MSSSAAEIISSSHTETGPSLVARILTALTHISYGAHRKAQPQTRALLKPNDSRLNCLTKSLRLFFDGLINSDLCADCRSGMRSTSGISDCAGNIQAPATKTTQERQHTRSMPLRPAE